MMDIITLGLNLAPARGMSAVWATLAPLGLSVTGPGSWRLAPGPLVVVSVCLLACVG